MIPWSVQFSSSVVSDSATPWTAVHQASLVHHQFPEFTQTPVHWVSDAIQPSHPLPPPSPALNLSQHQGLFQWVFTSGGQSTGASATASVLPMNIQDWFPLGFTNLISLLSKGLSRIFSSMIWKHQLFSISSCPFEMYANLFFLNLLIYLAVLGSISTSFFTSRNRFRPQWSTEATEKNQDVSQSHLSVFGVLGTRGQYKGVGVVCRLWLPLRKTSSQVLKPGPWPPEIVSP